MNLTFLDAVLKSKYEQFIQTKEGKTWKRFWQTKVGTQNDGDF